MNKPLAYFGIVAAAFLLGACRSTPMSHDRASPLSADADRAAIAGVLDRLHAFASQAREDEYFALFAPDAVFLGTDATERWSLDDFRAYAHPHFAAGRGWTYQVTRRFIGIGPDGSTAWFDEALSNAKLGECRGSGALVRTRESWKIVQYNLTIPVPNELADTVVQMIRKPKP